MTTATKAAAPVAAPVSDVKQEVLNISAAISHGMKIDQASGIATIASDVYEATLPEEITVEQIKALQAHNTTFIAGVAHALGTAAIPMMKKHKELDRVELTVGTVGKDTINATFDRSRQVPNRDPKSDGGTTTKFGSVGISLTTYGARPGVGQLGKVKKMLADQAAAAFGDK